MMHIEKEYKIFAGIALGAIVVGVLLFKFGNQEPSAPTLEPRASAYSKGAPQPKVVMTEFGDFQCPACYTAQSAISKLMTENPSDLRLVFRNFPLMSHPFALIAAQAAESAGAQGKFWEMHNMLYLKQPEWGELNKGVTEEKARAFFASYAQSIGLDMEKFNADMAGITYQDLIKQDVEAGLKAGANATPTFYMNGKKVPDPSYETLKKYFEEAKTAN